MGECDVTSKTARANAKIKADEKAAREALYAAWKTLLDDRTATTPDYLALGGTSSELRSFLYQHL